MVLAASLLTAGFVVAAGIVLWRQYQQQSRALEGLKVATERRDEARSQMTQELKRLHTWTAGALEALPPVASRVPEVAARPPTWSEPPLIDRTAVAEVKATPRRSRYEDHLVKFYGGGIEHVVPKVVRGVVPDDFVALYVNGRWIAVFKQEHDECPPDPFISYAAGAWPSCKADVDARHALYVDRWYPSSRFDEPETAVLADFAPQEARPA